MKNNFKNVLFLLLEDGEICLRSYQQNISEKRTITLSCVKDSDYYMSKINYRSFHLAFRIVRKYITTKECLTSFLNYLEEIREFLSEHYEYKENVWNDLITKELESNFRNFGENNYSNITGINGEKIYFGKVNVYGRITSIEPVIFSIIEDISELDLVEVKDNDCFDKMIVGCLNNMEIHGLITLKQNIEFLMKRSENV